MHVREYTTADRSACLAVFDSNLGKYFVPAEREGFAAFLDALPGRYLVIEDEVGAVLGCGGHAVELDTSQHTRGFYERVGFRVERVVPDGYAPGLDRCDMCLALGALDPRAG